MTGGCWWSIPCVSGRRGPCPGYPGSRHHTPHLPNRQQQIVLLLPVPGLFWLRLQCTPGLWSDKMLIYHNGFLNKKFTNIQEGGDGLCCGARSSHSIVWWFFFILEHYFIYRIKNLTLDLNCIRNRPNFTSEMKCIKTFFPPNLTKSPIGRARIKSLGWNLKLNFWCTRVQNTGGGPRRF